MLPPSILTFLYFSIHQTVDLICRRCTHCNIHTYLGARGQTVMERLELFNEGATVSVTSLGIEYTATLVDIDCRRRGTPILSVDFWDDGTHANDVRLHQCRLLTPARVVMGRISRRDTIGVWFHHDTSIRVASVVDVGLHFVRVLYLGPRSELAQTERVPGNRIVLHQPHPLTAGYQPANLSSKRIYGFRAEWPGSMMDLNGESYRNGETGLPESIFH